MEKICPIQSQSDDIFCQKDNCAWWSFRNEACAVLAIADQVTFYMDNCKELEDV